MDPNGDCMPEEILFDILTMLPVKSLCRFRCVSKSWFAIISNPDFIAAHLSRSRSRPKLLISVPDRRNKVMCFFSIDYPEQDMNNTQPLRPTFYSSTEFGDPAVISTSPSGLICFTCSDGVKIGNPITGDFTVIPYPISDPSTGLFFGFDRVEKSHVILKLEEHDYTTDDVGRSGVFDLVEYYWHLTQPHPWLSPDDSGICIDGVIYFSALTELECLYAFDIRLKSFQMIELPPDSLDRSLVNLLIEYKGRLAFVGYVDARDITVDQICCLWVLEDPKKKHVWSFKSFVVPWRENLMRDGISVRWSIFGLMVNLFGATHRGELILATPLSSGWLYLFLYEIETNLLRRFKIEGFSVNPCYRDEARFNSVIESLQTPKGLRRRRKRAAFINVHPPCS